FMGANNIVPLRLRGAGGQVTIGDGLRDVGIAINPSLLDGSGIRHASDDISIIAHFRSEDARLCPPDEAAGGCLVLRGEIVQCSYPGGFYRYAVRVGPRHYLVDDARRLAVGKAIGIALPATALHFYPAPQEAEPQHA